MRYLDLTATGMKLEKAKGADFKHIVAGSKNYLAVRINFSDDWNGMGKVAVFETKSKEYPVAVRGNIAVMPDKPASKSEVGVYIIGRKNGTQIITNTITLKLEVV